MPFVRRFKDDQEIGKTELFREYLVPDIINPVESFEGGSGDVFPAVRNGGLDFYHKGGKLFSFRAGSGFTTHHKFASVLEFDSKRPYVSENNLKAISCFTEGYKRIKENCSLYSGPEAAGISELYSHFSCAKKTRLHELVVLDIEISLASPKSSSTDLLAGDGQNKQDRIDLLLMNTKTGGLRFYEAKHYSNSNIRAKHPSIPNVVWQMKRYRDNLRGKVTRDKLLVEYAHHVNVINRLFAPKTPLPLPTKIDPEPWLLIFGFDQSQRNKLKSEMITLRENNVFSQIVGDPRQFLSKSQEP